MEFLILGDFSGKFLNVKFREFLNVNLEFLNIKFREFCKFYKKRN